ncbi:hypothetical protein [Nostoc sp. PCC 7107]|uniref:hypothetical protein n=1 Tax=Nostoc sp. PCC 7107 TaxID=317936 RepID=UPI00029EDCDA|nr:hypothetical protein [Nostoc sp. PCC 7107]AFY43660.1 hypothetical protein Nos7107_3069 [Nostoc sp. PCC 7107]
MTISSINIVKPIVLSLNNTSTNEVYRIFEDEPFSTENGSIISENIFLKNLKAYVKISSLAPAQLPDISIEDSQVQATYKTLNAEWISERKQLNLLISTGDNQWFPVGSISLLNPSGYPYRIHNLMDLYTDNLMVELGQTGRLGVQLQDVGTGLLVGSDTITIHGSYLKEVVIDDTAQSITTSNDFAVSVSGSNSPVLAANTNRKYVVLINNSLEDIYINLSETSQAGQGILLKADGGSYEFYTSTINYKGAITASTFGDTAAITGIEAI